MDALIQAFLVSRQSDGCTPKTIRHHVVSLNNFKQWATAQSLSGDPQTWSTQTLRTYVMYLQTKKTPSGKVLSGYSVTTYVQSLKTWLKFLYEEEFTDTDLGARLKKPRTPQTQKQPYTNDELKRMLAAVKSNARDHAILTLLIDCGLRANELCNLQPSDVNLNQLLIHVKLGKGRKDRVVPMSLQAAKVVSKYLVKHQGVFLFSTAKREQFSPNSLLQLVQRVGMAANVSKPSVHRFRHCFALSWLRNGGDVMTLQKVMGHADLKTTQGYLALSTDDLTKAHLTASPLMRLTKTRTTQ